MRANKHQLNVAKCAVCTCFNLRKAARAVTQFYSGIIRVSDLRGTQFSILAIVTMKGSATIKQLADLLVMDRTTLTRDLKVMEDHGLIKIASGKDRRMRVVTLTARGRKALVNALPLWERAQARMVQGLGEERFRRLLSDLAAAVTVARAG